MRRRQASLYRGREPACRGRAEPSVIGPVPQRRRGRNRSGDPGGAAPRAPEREPLSRSTACSSGGGIIRPSSRKPIPLRGAVSATTGVPARSTLLHRAARPPDGRAPRHRRPMPRLPGGSATSSRAPWPTSASSAPHGAPGRDRANPSSDRGGTVRIRRPRRGAEHRAAHPM